MGRGSRRIRRWQNDRQRKKKAREKRISADQGTARRGRGGRRSS